MIDDGRVIRVNSDPIGIDVPALESQILDPQVYSMCRFLKDRHSGKKLLVSRDKFDHIKGLKPKLLAYERFLADHPEWVEKVGSLGDQGFIIGGFHSSGSSGCRSRGRCPSL